MYLEKRRWEHQVQLELSCYCLDPDLLPQPCPVPLFIHCTIVTDMWCISSKQNNKLIPLFPSQWSHTNVYSPVVIIRHICIIHLPQCKECQLSFKYCCKTTLFWYIYSRNGFTETCFKTTIIYLSVVSHLRLNIRHLVGNDLGMFEIKSYTICFCFFVRMPIIVV